MKPLTYLRARSLPVLALALAFQKVMGTQPAERKRGVKAAGGCANLADEVVDWDLIGSPHE